MHRTVELSDKSSERCLLFCGSVGGVCLEPVHRIIKKLAWRHVRRLRCGVVELGDVDELWPWLELLEIFGGEIGGAE